MVKIYTGTVDENAARAIDPETGIYDKRKVEDVSYFDNLYFYFEEAFSNAIANSINVAESLEQENPNKKVRPVLIEGEANTTDVYPCPFHPISRMEGIIYSKKFSVGGVYLVNGKTYLESLNNKNKPVSDLSNIKDITSKFINSNPLKVS